VQVTEIQPTTFTLAAVVSADGFIARRAGDHPRTWASAEEQARFLARLVRYDWAFMGRMTHETALRHDRRRVVFSRGAAGLDWRTAQHLWVDPAKVALDAILAVLRPVRPPRRCIVLGGTTVHEWFLERGLIDRIELTVEPLRFGAGLTLLSGQPPGDLTAELARRGFAAAPPHVLSGQGTYLVVLTRL
jgi:dihydrofolate reductase